MAVFTILHGHYYPPHEEFELICIGKFSRRTWVNFTQQYGKNRHRCQQNKFIMLYGNYCYIFKQNFPQKFYPCIMNFWNHWNGTKKTHGSSYIAQNIAETCQKYFQFFIANQILQNISSQLYNFNFLKYFWK